MLSSSPTTNNYKHNILICSCTDLDISTFSDFYYKAKISADARMGERSQVSHNASMLSHILLACCII